MCVFKEIASVSGTYEAGICCPICRQFSNLDSNFVVDNLKPVSYINKITNKKDIGFIAHEVQNIYPELVIGYKDDKIYQSINYTGLIPILIREIKELKQRILNLETLK